MRRKKALSASRLIFVTSLVNIRFMKILSLIFGISLFVFVSCLGSEPRVEFLSFYSNGSVELHVVPDYEDRSLKVEYFEEDEDLGAEGDLGEEYYDRFNEVVGLFYGHEDVFIPDDSFSGDDISFGVFVMGEYGEAFVLESFDYFGEEDFRCIQSFYLDVTNLLTQDVQI